VHYADLLHDTSPRSAAVVVPLLVELCEPSSVLDVGCGVGAWLAEFSRLGITDLHGVDSSPPETVSLIAPDQFARVDLASGFTVDRAFDLALCLEVGEHLPLDSAGALVASLIAAAPVVAFSAAVPGQDGPSHVNLQPPAFWRGLFAGHGYRQHDPFRALLWDDPCVAWWYAQNLFVYSSREIDTPRPVMPEHVVHPQLLADRVAQVDPRAHGLREVVGAIPSAVRRSLHHRLKRL
jgi:SAM-dependent methyltransferase